MIFARTMNNTDVWIMIGTFAFVALVVALIVVYYELQERKESQQKGQDASLQDRGA